MTHGFARQGHTYMCRNCGFNAEYVGTVIAHVKAVHRRKVSAPEYLQVTTRQLRDFRASLKAKA